MHIVSQPMTLPGHKPAGVVVSGSRDPALSVAEDARVNIAPGSPMPAISILDIRKTLGTIACAVVAFAAVGCAGQYASVRPDQVSEASATVVREDLKFPIEKGVSTIEVVNSLGEISVRNREQVEVAVHGVIQELPPDFARARIISRQEGDVLRISAELPQGAKGGRYDMAVYVPSGLPLILKGGEHRIDVRKREAPLTASTTSGAINASTNSWMDVSSESGSIKAIARGENWIGRSQVRSTSGRILMLVPLSGNVSLNVETGGRLTNNFGLSVHPREGGGSRASARYGSGTSELRISSDSGEVILEQAVLLEQDGE
jgi:hypothetical protein